MSDILSEMQHQVLLITLNRVAKRNAFDDKLLHAIQQILDEAAINPQIRVIVLKANGSDFSAGADLAWMQRMVHFTEEENQADSLVLAKLMYTLHHHPKPTIAMVQGAAFGGGVGLVAACNMAIAADTASFCFSEVKLGLIPAVISPYVIQAIGPRAALNLFVTAEVFHAKRAYELQLIQHCVPADQLLPFTLNYANRIVSCAPLAIQEAKQLVHDIYNRPIDEHLQHYTASLIAKKRVSAEGQRGLHAFLKKEKPIWE